MLATKVLMCFVASNLNSAKLDYTVDLTLVVCHGNTVLVESEFHQLLIARSKPQRPLLLLTLLNASDWRLTARRSHS